jgi:hypothetical protein
MVPQICTDGIGGAFISWTDDRNSGTPGMFYDLYMQHINSTGSVLWTSDGIAVSSEIGYQETQKMCYSRIGGYI